METPQAPFRDSSPVPPLQAPGSLATAGDAKPARPSFVKSMRDRLKLIFKFKILTTALYARKRLYSLVMPGAERVKLMINVGGGLFFRPRWKVLDYVSPLYPFNRRFIEYDVNLCGENTFPLADDSVSIFYSAHTLEHIPQEYCPHILREIHRCLKPGGAVRLNMPDYDRMRHAVETGDRSYFASHLSAGLTIEEAVVEQIATERIRNVDADKIHRDYETMSAAEFADHYTSTASREVQKEMGGYHINWFNEEKLAAMLREAGFVEVYRSQPQGSRFTELTGKGGVLAIGDILEVQRWLGIDTTIPVKSLYMEAVK